MSEAQGREEVHRILFRIPQDLYEEIEELAELETRTINSQLIAMLKESLRRREERDMIWRQLLEVREREGKIRHDAPIVRWGP